MWSRRLITILIAIAFGLWDATVAPWFPGSVSAIKLTLPFVVVLAVFSRQERAVMAAIASGVILDIFLPSNAGLVSVRYLLIAVAIYSLRQHILTNRSLIGVSVLGALSVFTNRILLIIIEPVQSMLGRNVIPEEPPVFWAELLWMVFVMVFIFLLFAAFSRRFLPLVSRSTKSGPI